MYFTPAYVSYYQNRSTIEAQSQAVSPGIGACCAASPSRNWPPPPASPPTRCAASNAPTKDLTDINAQRLADALAITVEEYRSAYPPPTRHHRLKRVEQLAAVEPSE